jgi:transcriptional regulator with XRE-family HTH domain
MPGVFDAVPAALALLEPRLARIRRQHGLTLEELARRSGLSAAYLSRVESGQRQPSLASLLSVAEAYGVSLGSLVDDAATDPVEPVVRGE